ncbi:MAG: PfkB family carbohydrate kinase [Candidatus Dormibacteria bacterium]
MVGSVAFDDLETPSGSRRDVLGGAATYFSLAARLFGPVQLVAVVGEDFPAESRRLLQDAGVDLTGLMTAPGRTFRWHGRYHEDLETRDTLDLQLNVFEGWRPRLSEAEAAAEHVFLGTIDPNIQLEVLAQIRAPRLSGTDTISHWIVSEREKAGRVLGSVDLVVINREEACLFAGTQNLAAAGAALLANGARAVIVKKGEDGAVLFTAEGRFVSPAMILSEVHDPTGAGDSFAGAVVGYLARIGRYDHAALCQAVVLGNVIASFTVEDFGPARLLKVTWDEVSRRYREIRGLTAFEDVVMPADL